METTQLEHPLQQTFARVTQFNQYVKPQFGEPQDAGWIVPTVLLLTASTELATMVSLTQERLHTKSANMIAGALIQAYQWP